MTKQTKISKSDSPRFNEAEMSQVLGKLATVAAGIEAQWHAIAETGDTVMRGRHLDTILVLAQVAGFIADYAGEDCAGYGDVFHWLEIPEGVKS